MTHKLQYRVQYPGTVQGIINMMIYNDILYTVYSTDTLILILIYDTVPYDTYRKLD